MGKVWSVILVVIGVSILYLLMLVLMPVLVDFANTANTTIGATTNVTNYPGAQEAVVAAPWVLWFVPGTLGMIVIVVILKQP